MDQTMVMSGTHTPSVFGLIIDGIGILVGLFAVILVLRTLSKIGGQVGIAFRFTLLGVISQMLALTYNVLTEELAIISVPSAFFGIITVHHLHDGLMIIGMVFFVLAARSFSKLST